MLSEIDKATLDIEATRWKFAGAKDAAIRERFDESPTRYYQRLHELLKNPEALQFAPLTVNRLLRLEAERRRQRSADRMP